MTGTVNPMQALAMASPNYTPVSTFDLGTSPYDFGYGNYTNPNFSPVATASPVSAATSVPVADISQQLASFGSAVPAGAEPTTMQTLFGGKLADGSTQMGMIPAGLGTANSLLSGWLGMKQYGLAKKQINSSIDMSKRNFNAQANTINSQLEDRQRYRAMTQPGANQDVASYMAKYGVQKV